MKSKHFFDLGGGGLHFVGVCFGSRRRGGELKKIAFAMPMMFPHPLGTSNNPLKCAKPSEEIFLTFLRAAKMFHQKKSDVFCTLAGDQFSPPLETSSLFTRGHYGV